MLLEIAPRKGAWVHRTRHPAMIPHMADAYDDILIFLSLKIRRNNQASLLQRAQLH